MTSLLFTIRQYATNTNEPKQTYATFYRNTIQHAYQSSQRTTTFELWLEYLLLSYFTHSKFINPSNNSFVYLVIKSIRFSNLSFYHVLGWRSFKLITTEFGVFSNLCQKRCELINVSEKQFYWNKCIFTGSVWMQK